MIEDRERMCACSHFRSSDRNCLNTSESLINVIEN